MWQKVSGIENYLFNREKISMKKYILTFILLTWIALLLRLSFETGTATAKTSYDFTKRVLQFLSEKVDWQAIVLWDRRFRVAAHFVTFFLYEILGISVLKSYKLPSLAVWIIGGFSGIFFAVVTEVGKLQIAGRHCDLPEMGLNLAGVFLGLVLMQAADRLLKKKVDECSL